jgi:hypothetical protein
VDDIAISAAGRTDADVVRMVGAGIKRVALGQELEAERWQGTSPKSVRGHHQLLEQVEGHHQPSGIKSARDLGRTVRNMRSGGLVRLGRIKKANPSPDASGCCAGSLSLSLFLKVHVVKTLLLPRLLYGSAVDQPTMKQIQQIRGMAIRASPRKGIFFGNISLVIREREWTRERTSLCKSSVSGVAI